MSAMKTIASTYEKTANILKAENKRELFELIYFNANMIGGIAEVIAEFLIDCGSTFVADIAKKYLGGKGISEKQAWCMTYEAIKIKHMIYAYIEKEMEIMNTMIAAIDNE
jgi:hypothetical protein